MTRQWVAADLKTGRILADMPSLELANDAPLRRSLSGFDSVSARLYVADAPENWERATKQCASLLACYDDETLPDGSQPNAIQWAGYVATNNPVGDDDAVDLSLVTLEGYFDRRYSGDETHSTGWRATIAATIALNVITGAEPGLDLLQLSYTGAGTVPVEPLVWQNADNVTILARMQQLIGQFGGEFTVEWAWSADGMSLVPTLVMGDRIGFQATTHLPEVTFEYPGVLEAPTQAKDYSDGNGANKLVAFSASGEVLPVVYADDFEGRPTFEYRYSPETSVTDDAVLLSYAQQKMKILGPGANTISGQVAIDATALRGRRLGVDWHLGDDVGLVLTSPVWPDGLFGVARVVAYEVSGTTINPTFAPPSVYGGS